MGFTLGLLWLHLADRYLPAAANRGIPGAAMAYYYIFSGVAIGAAGRVITHRKPVYAALWFVMVVLASSGLLVVLSAEFMAFGMHLLFPEMYTGCTHHLITEHDVVIGNIWHAIPCMTLRNFDFIAPKCNFRC